MIVPGPGRRPDFPSELFVYGQHHIKSQEIVNRTLVARHRL